MGKRGRERGREREREREQVALLGSKLSAQIIYAAVFDSGQRREKGGD